MRVEVRSGPDVVRAREFTPGADAFEVTVGSDPSCDILIDDPSVLPVHARIELRGWHTFVTPAHGAAVHAFDTLLPSGNSARVDDNPFRIGDYTLRVSE
jgi:predicted component of type VI protein secretion system